MTLRWAVGLLCSVLVCNVALAASSSVKIEDKTISGRKANVEKVDSEYGLQVVSLSEKYMLCNKDDDASPNYYGFEAADGSWVIMKWTVSAGADVFAYDHGTSSYSTNWTNRASLSYQSWGTEF